MLSDNGRLRAIDFGQAEEAQKEDKMKKRSKHRINAIFSWLKEADRECRAVQAAVLETRSRR